MANIKPWHWTWSWGSSIYFLLSQPITLSIIFHVLPKLQRGFIPLSVTICHLTHSTKPVHPSLLDFAILNNAMVDPTWWTEYTVAQARRHESMCALLFQEKLWPHPPSGWFLKLPRGQGCLRFCKIPEWLHWHKCVIVNLSRRQPKLSRPVQLSCEAACSVCVRRNSAYFKMQVPECCSTE